MKASSVFPGLFSVALLAVSLPAQDEPKAAPPPPDRAVPMVNRREELLKRYDKNGDGVLDDEERKAMILDIMKNGGPGKPGEWIRAELLKRFDENGDGQLDETELARAMQFIKERATQDQGRPAGARAGGLGRIPAELLRRFDKNGDGVLDEQEMAEARKFFEEQMKQFNTEHAAKPAAPKPAALPDGALIDVNEALAPAHPPGR